MAETFPLEKILTCNVYEYCESRGKTPFAYDLKGVHVANSSLDDFQESIPRDVEVVVDFKSSIAYNNGVYYIASGTALIPKKESPREA